MDLIERQAAIDTLDKHLRTTDVPVSYPGIISALTEWLNELPSAQPDSKELSFTHKALDTVSRQAVIEAINKIFPADPMRDDYTQGITCGAALANIYVGQLPSAQPEKRTDKCTEMHACDCISRQAVLKAINNMVKECDSVYVTSALRNLGTIVADLPSARSEPSQVARDIATILENEKDMRVIADLSEYSDKLWKAAYERGKAEAQPDLDEVYAHAETEAEARYHAERKKGKWIPVTRIEEWHEEEGLVGFPPEVKEFPQCTIKWVDATEPDEVDGLRCSECDTVYDFTEARNWCSECGADMRTPVETARDIVHEAIDNSVWSDTVDTAKMHNAVDDKYAEIRGDANADVKS